MAVYFFHGEEDFNIEHDIEELKKTLDKNFIEMSFKVYDNPKYADLISILRTQPMMFGKMLVVIKCLDYFSKTFEDKEIKEITKALEDNNDNLDIVFVAQLPRDEGKKLDSRRKLYKLLSKFNVKEFPVIPSYKTAELEAWIKKQAQSKKMKLTQDALTSIITQIGNNLRQINSELDKLQIIAYPDNVVSGEMVKENCVSNEDLFAFSDYLLAGEKDKALKEYRKLLDKKYCLEIVSGLQTMVRRWIVLKTKSAEASSFELARITGQHEYVVKLTLQKLKKANLKDLVNLKNNITKAEYRIKSGQSLNPESEIENAFFN